MATHETDLVLCESEAGITILTLNRPHRRNAMTPEVQRLLIAHLKEAEQDADTRVVVITGAGNDFCVGGDFEIVERMTADPTYRRELEAVHAAIAKAVLAFPKPTIAAVNGAAFGFGAELAAFCDMTVMSENASLADPHVRYGLEPAPGALLIWPQLTSRAIAAELMLTGREVSAEEAVRLGLANRFVPEGGALAEAMKLARDICALPGEGVSAIKQALRRSYAAMLRAAEEARP